MTDASPPRRGAFARFLDFVYTNTISTLPVGRVRYGLMLREDGMVMDDGTVARLGDRHYLMTTTTAAAFSRWNSVTFRKRVPPSNMSSHHTEMPAASSAALIRAARALSGRE